MILQHDAHKVVGGHRGQGTAKLKNAQLLDAMLGQGKDLAAQPLDFVRRRLRIKQCLRVGFERHHGAQQTRGLGQGDDPVDQGLMPHVHPIEIPNGDRTIPTWGSARGNSLKNQHVGVISGGANQTVNYRVPVHYDPMMAPLTPSASDRIGRIVVLLSGRGSNFLALLQAIEAHRWPMQVVGVLSNRGQAEGLAHARTRGIPVQVISHHDYPTREAFDAAMAEVVGPWQPDVVVLAGFMRILSANFCQRFGHQMLNIHPSLLPSFKGLHTHQQALEAGVTLHGCTVHAVTAELDHGPILAQAVVPVLPDDHADRLAARVLTMEHRLYPMAVAAVVSGRCRLDNGRWHDVGRGYFDHDFHAWLVAENP